MSDDPKCDICEGDLDIKATLIGCRSCRTIWGRCNGAWVEVRDEKQLRYERDEAALLREHKRGDSWAAGCEL